MMMFPERGTLAELRKHRMVWTGTGNGTVPTLTYGHGVTLSWTATGRVLITWAENPGTFCGIASAHFRDATQSNVKGWTANCGAYPATASTFTLEVDIWNASQTAADLATTSLFDLTLEFSELKSP